jgi:hypothetical protein
MASRRERPIFFLPLLKGHADYKAKNDLLPPFLKDAYHPMTAFIDWCCNDDIINLKQGNL